MGTFVFKWNYLRGVIMTFISEFPRPFPPTISHAGSTFTGSNGLGTATASTLTLSIAAATAATSWSDMPRITKNLSYLDPWRLDAVAKLASVSGHNANTFLPFALRDSSGNLLILIQSAGNNVVTIYDSSGLLANAGSIGALDGTEWCRIVLRDSVSTIYRGVGSSGSQDWTPLWRGNVKIPASSSFNYTYLSFNLYQGSGAAGTVTAQWSDVYTTLLY